VLLIRAALRDVPFLGWLAVGYLLATLAVRWSRLRQEFLPGFFQAVGSIGRREGTPYER
jgi:hypothetical protein